MNDEFNERLASAKTAARQSKSIDAKLEVAQLALPNAIEKQRRLKVRVAKEQADVGSLEGLSITGLMLSMFGKKESRLDRERQELAVATLQYEQAVKDVDDLKEDIVELEANAKEYEDAVQNYERMLDRKEAYISESNSAVAGRLVEMSQAIAELESDRTELQEAVDAGKAAKHAITEVEATLDSAKNWGTLDMFGGGALTTMVKHSKIDNAKEQVRHAQRKLATFERELAGAGHQLQTSIEIDGFTHFADYFFDGLVVDWIVQSKIEKAKTECSNISLRVNKVISNCKESLRCVDAEIKEKTEERRDLIASV
ncbi:MAG: hypothetical protein AAF664_21035 [Planctomycetota bacterium]